MSKVPGVRGRWINGFLDEWIIVRADSTNIINRAVFRGLNLIAKRCVPSPIIRPSSGRYRAYGGDGADPGGLGINSGLDEIVSTEELIGPVVLK